MTNDVLLDPDEAVLRLRHKPSFQGGRPWASPAKTARQLSVTRRTAGKSSQDLSARGRELEVQLHGSLGPAPREVLRQLMAVVERQAGFQILEASLDSLPSAVTPAATWVWAGAFDPMAPPGQMRLTLTSAEQVAAVYAQVHGRAIQIGGDMVSITVTDDLSLGAGLSKNGRGGRGRRGPAPA